MTGYADKIEHLLTLVDYIRKKEEGAVLVSLAFFYFILWTYIFLHLLLLHLPTGT